MKTISVVLVLLSLSAVTWPQNDAPPVLRGAAHCLWAENFELGKPGSSALTLGYTIDKKSYPGQTVMYVVSYTKQDRSKGLVYTIFITESDGKTSFNIQNNATFRRSKNGVDFTGEPLGGVWTHQQLISAIESIAQQPTFTIGVVDAFATTHSTQCESYTDNRQK